MSRRYRLPWVTSAGVAGESMKDWFEAFGDKIYHIRFVDGRPQGCLAWGDGLRPLEDQLICLDQYKYKGLLSLALNDARCLEDRLQPIGRICVNWNRL